MRPSDLPLDTTWHARLELDYEHRAGRTVLAARRHDGPLIVQKPLYPEGDAVCHGIIIHPPAGIAGGDRLALRVAAGAQAHALLTTPGAGKWYRSAGRQAQQHLKFEVAAGACLEWLPQESIVFDGALAQLHSEIHLAPGARYVGWEVLCLGRTGSGERFTRGVCALDTRVLRDGRLLWLERGEIKAGGTLMRSAAGLGNNPVCGTLIAAADNIADSVLAACRETVQHETQNSAQCAVTRLPGLLIARYLGASGEAAKQVFTALWKTLRPALLGRDAVPPRIWST